MLQSCFGFDCWILKSIKSTCSIEGHAGDQGGCWQIVASVFARLSIEVCIQATSSLDWKYSQVEDISLHREPFDCHGLSVPSILELAYIVWGLSQRSASKHTMEVSACFENESTVVLMRLANACIKKCIPAKKR